MIENLSSRKDFTDPGSSSELTVCRRIWSEMYFAGLLQLGFGGLFFCFGFVCFGFVFVCFEPISRDSEILSKGPNFWLLACESSSNPSPHSQQ